MKFGLLVAYISVFSPVIAFSVYAFGKNFKSPTNNVLIGMSILAFCSDLISIYVGRKGNHHILDIYFPAHLVVAIILYYTIYLNQRTLYHVLCTLCLPSLAFCYIVFWRQSESSQYTNWAICTFIIEVMAIGHFYTLSKKPVENIRRHAPYWISIGFFFYCSISMIIFSLQNYLLKNFQLEVAIYVWALHNVMNIVKNLCFAVAISIEADGRFGNRRGLSNIFRSLNQLF